MGVWQAEVQPWPQWHQVGKPYEHLQRHLRQSRVRHAWHDGTFRPHGRYGTTWLNGWTVRHHGWYESNDGSYDGRARLLQYWHGWLSRRLQYGTNFASVPLRLLYVWVLSSRLRASRSRQRSTCRWTLGC